MRIYHTVKLVYISVIGGEAMKLKRRLKAFFTWPSCFGKRSKQRKQEIEVRKSRYFLCRFVHKANEWTIRHGFMLPYCSLLTLYLRSRIYLNLLIILKKIINILSSLQAKKHSCQVNNCRG